MPEIAGERLAVGDRVRHAALGIARVFRLTTDPERVVIAVPPRADTMLVYVADLEGASEGSPLDETRNA